MLAAGRWTLGQMNCERGKVGKLADGAGYAKGVDQPSACPFVCGSVCLFVIAFKANKCNYLLHFAALDTRTSWLSCWNP